MTTRTTTTLALIVAVTLLAGCAPQPDRTPRADCAPETARVSWQPKQDGESAETGYSVAVVDADGVAEVTEHVIDYSSQISEVTGQDLPADEWTEFLTTEFERTGQVGSTRVGEPAPGFDSVSYEYIPSTTTILGLRVTQIRVPFALSCGAADVSAGVFTTTDGANLISTVVDCATPDPVANDQVTEQYALDLLDYCPPA